MPMEDRLISPADLARYVSAVGESDRVDFKGPGVWDGAKSSARLTKDIIACANSQDGGVIVIGKSEVSPGQFQLDGLTPDQVGSFETTRVADWVNARCSPPVDLVCCPFEVDGRTVMVIVVGEFRDVPIVCVKPFDPDLSRGLYVRTSSAASAPITREDEVRRLVGLAVRKQGDVLATTLSAILSGRPTSPPPDASAAAIAHVEPVLSELRNRLLGGRALGAWEFTLCPLIVRERFHGVPEIKVFLEASAVRSRMPIPWLYLLEPREFGAQGVHDEQGWACTREGAFVVVIPFDEDRQFFEPPWKRMGAPADEGRLPPGGWLDVLRAMARIVDLYHVASRIAVQLPPEEQLRVTLSAMPLTGRRLVCTQPNVEWDLTKRATASKAFLVPVEVTTAAALRGEWRQRSEQAVERLLDLFPDTQIPKSVIQHWVERFSSS